jgi:hypothetical protein
VLARRCNSVGRLQRYCQSVHGPSWPGYVCFVLEPLYVLLCIGQVWAPSCNITQKPRANGSSSSPVAADGVADAAADSGYSSDSSAYGSSPTSAGSSGMFASRAADGSGSHSTGQQQQQQSPASKRTYRRSNEELQQGPRSPQNGSSEPAAAAAAAGVEPQLVEVDVVAHEGLTWIEVKNQVRHLGKPVWQHH